MRLLAVDHGEKRIGVAVSDSTSTLARPLTVLGHVSRAEDARRVAEAALAQDVALIVIGQTFDEEGLPNRAGQAAAHFADALKQLTEIPIVMWDESMSTQDAAQARLRSGVPLRKRRGAVDALAAAMILQSYLDAHHDSASQPRLP